MWYAIILLSIALAVSVGFWVKADRMAAHYRREAQKERNKTAEVMSRLEFSERARELLIDDEREAQDKAYGRLINLKSARRQLAAARGQITKLRRKYGEIE